MSLEWKAYVSDPRTICKYGSKCYQKNPDHHKTYKHPPHSKNNTEHIARNRRWSPYQRDADHRKHRDNSLDHKLENADISQTNKRFNETSSHDKTEIETKMEQNDASTKQRDSSEASTSTVKIAPSKYENTTAVIKLPENITYYNRNTDTKILKDLFLVEMPPDFFQFYKCLSEDDGFENMLAGVNLELIGPYDLLLGKLPILDEKELYLIHWRYFYDPPEFQAVLKKKGKSQFHMGYFRDEPDGAPVFVASNDSEKGYHITPMAENIFAAVYIYLQNEKKSSPFTSMACQKLMDKVKKWAEAHNYSVEEFNMKKRLGQMVTKTFHGAGIVVPYNKKTQLGYRRLVETDVNLRKLFNKLESAKTEAEKDSILSEIQPVITYANIAVDECDFGTGLEVGVDLFCSGLKELQSDTVSCLTAAYSLLNRNAFSKIIQVHIKYRRKGPNMSVLSVSGM